MLNAQQRALADRLFEEALTLPPEKQSAFLAQYCDDPEVRSEIESLPSPARAARLSSGRSSKLRRICWRILTGPH